MSNFLSNREIQNFLEQKQKYSKDQELGCTEIAPEVIESIAGIRKAQVEGFLSSLGFLNTIFVKTIIQRGLPTEETDHL